MKLLNWRFQYWHFNGYFILFTGTGVMSLFPITHQVPIVWKLAEVQAAGSRYIRGPVYDILVLHFK